jgi:GLPGLI family protein
MKIIISLSACLFTLAVYAQPKSVTQAYISTTMNIIAPETEDVQNLQSGQEAPRGGMGMNWRGMMDGETKITTYLKGDMVKNVMKSDMGRSTSYRDNKEKRTTMVMEMMGNKMGFTTTDEEMAAMQKRRDSMMAERKKADTSSGQRRETTLDKSNMQVDFIKTNETKKIAGYQCQKGYLITQRLIGAPDTSVVWYTPEFKIDNFSSLGSMANGMPGPARSMMPSLNGLEKIDGFALRYEMKMRGNRRVEVEVNKIDLDKKIDDKEFALPNDVEIKPMREMRNMFGGGRGGEMRF